MRILQLLPGRPSEYEKKSQRIDFELLRSDHNVSVGERVNADVTLVYGRPPVSELPEAVEERYWSGGQAILPVRTDKIVCPPHTIASFRRRSIVPLVEQT